MGVLGAVVPLLFGVAWSSQHGWMTDFTNKSEAQEYFVEDVLHLKTSGCSACTTKEAVLYNHTLMDCKNGEPRPLGRTGLVMRMQNEHATCGGHRASVTTGHLESRQAFMYGAFSFTWRGHHVEGCGEPAKYAGFSCVSLYTSTPRWNEVSVCFTKIPPHQEVHFSVYNAGKDRGKKVSIYQAFVTLDEPAYAGFHNYTFERLPSGLGFFVDGVSRVSVSAGDVPNLPDLPMRLKVILRPYGHKIDSAGTYVSLQSVSYRPVRGAGGELSLEHHGHQTAWLHITHVHNYFNLKKGIFHALGVVYPAGRRGRQYPVKYGRMLERAGEAVIEMHSAEEAARVVASARKHGLKYNRKGVVRLVTAREAGRLGYPKAPAPEDAFALVPDDAAAGGVVHVPSPARRTLPLGHLGIAAAVCGVCAAALLTVSHLRRGGSDRQSLPCRDLIAAE
mmetsp:Transcript_112075/g.349294  ORF Transcript_112075/g.349294 Transcript_112075/m.349294 type:complete len:447 (-) Transcript_112075:529-1869(-)